MEWQKLKTADRTTREGHGIPKLHWRGRHVTTDLPATSLRINRKGPSYLEHSSAPVPHSTELLILPTKYCFAQWLLEHYLICSWTRLGTIRYVGRAQTRRIRWSIHGFQGGPDSKRICGRTNPIRRALA